MGDDSMPIISCYVHCALDFWLKDEFPIKIKSHSNSLRFPLTMDEKWTQMKIFNLFIRCLHELYSDPVLWCCKTKILLSGWLKIDEQTFLIDADSQWKHVFRLLFGLSSNGKMTKTTMHIQCCSILNIDSIREIRFITCTKICHHVSPFGYIDGMR